MKDIKLRSWNERNKDFLYSNIKDIWKNGVECVRAGAYSSEFNKYGMSDSEITENTFIPNADWEMFTGLKDKFRNDKEVYEGDIYKWIGVTFAITVDSFHGNRFMFGKDILCRAYIEEGHFLGNIHENPELLK